jgi:hypothetical protein
MKITDILEIPPHVMARQVGDEVVILDLNGGTYFGLDAVGARVWDVIGSGGKSIADACSLLICEYEVPCETLERDVMVLAHDLKDRGLVVVAGS